MPFHATKPGENQFDPLSDGSFECRVTKWRAVPAIPRLMGQELEENQPFGIIAPDGTCYGICHGVREVPYVLNIVFQSFNHGRLSMARQIQSATVNPVLSHGKLT
jgi:hypothetical protein